MGMQERLVSEQRRDRELGLAYRIASARMQVATDARALVASSEACVALAQRLASLTGETAAAECRRSWASVGALEEPAAVLRALTKLEQMCEADLERARKKARAEDEARVLDEALAAHRARRQWLQHRTVELEAF